MKKIFYISFLFYLSGCAGTLKRHWTNFQAYYNSYYNAKLSFREGLRKVEDQQQEIDITEPIRIYPKPIEVGEQDFQDAIEKGAKILSKYPDSKWTDETLELMGKSYYYRQEYYSALQKFEDQYNITQNSQMRQRAVIWKGRVLLDLKLYDQGIVFLNSELSTLAEEWEPQLKAEVLALLAEHYVQQKNWNQVEALLQDALPDLGKGPLKAKTYFLLGQVLEVQKKYGEAASAFAKVQDNRPEFELMFWAKYKQAEVLRNMGNLNEATDIYKQMRKDDKYVDRLAQIDYPIAMIEEERGNIADALQMYKDLLHNQIYQVSRPLQADIYYRLGQIYTNHVKKYQVAAAYYDSASSLIEDSDRAGMFAKNLNIKVLAEAYGRYSTLRSKIVRLDSLLWLGSLPTVQFDSVITEIRTRKQQQLLQEVRQSRESSNALENIGIGRQPVLDDSSSNTYGFLNHKNSRLMIQVQNQFRALWGNRPLADNWRTNSAIPKRGRTEQGTEGNQVSSNGGAMSGQGDLPPVTLDLSDIPFTQEQKQQTRNELAAAKYELGNLFLFTLQIPDSAASYFKSVVEDFPKHPLVPKALYSLYELYSSQNNSKEAGEWGRQLQQDFPASSYTRQLFETQNGITLTERQDSANTSLKEKVSDLLSSQILTASLARELRSLALTNKDSTAAPFVHYEAIKQYIKLAKEHQSMQRVFGADTLAIPDSSVSSIPVSPELSYYGGYWDSVRVVLNEHEKYFGGSPSSVQAEKLAEELSRAKQADLAMPTCEELNVTPEIEGGLSDFLQHVSFPTESGSKSFADSVNYEMVITSIGQVESFVSISSETDSTIEEAFTKAIKQYLSFKPFNLGNDSISKVRCQVTFPLSQNR